MAQRVEEEEDRKTAEQARACSAVFGEKTVLSYL